MKKIYESVTSSLILTDSFLDNDIQILANLDPQAIYWLSVEIFSVYALYLLTILEKWKKVRGLVNNKIHPN